jgi:hypothetical protein
MFIPKRATSHSGFSHWRLSKRRFPALMERKPNDQEPPLGEMLGGHERAVAELFPRFLSPG